MATFGDGNELDSTPPFGAYAPTEWQKRVLALTRSMPDTWPGKRAAFLLRRLLMAGLKHPLDVEAFGAHMRLHPFNNVCEKRILFTPQFFDPQERALLAARVRPDFVFIDIGANVGAYALFVAKLAGAQARILAIEPQPVIFDRLVYNIGENPGAMVKAIGCALADKDGELTLFVDSNNRGESSIKILGWTGETGQSVQVSARTLIGLAGDEGLTRIDAMKIDVEGAEEIILEPFLRDAPESLLPGFIIIENARTRWQTDCIELLHGSGYRTLLETKLNVVLERAAVRR